ncbi:ArsR/SmtB family transcription factor [Zophobihabitans entericus]|uniref:Winged helix-turn-helix transcriptional regulator n=1 Tax=Zophobihabitans entericus TaxID=1635327 RepID=A0A6G9IAY7_9GAMM|nr:metalloregulator ArsR/SmtB family transcription factor [Zophobihabitans entericus]QIQ21398.1 winged helix-turn-helix transcriptional regulator [Zophobihabitans entericus]
MQNKLAEISTVIGDKTRINMLCLLMDGRAYTATELSIAVDIAPSTASVHLNKLVEQKLIECLKQGKYRYFRLASPAVAQLLESLMNLTSSLQSIPSTTPDELKYCRTCYDHMAGKIAVDLLSFMKQEAWITGENEYSLTPIGSESLTQMGLNIKEIVTTKSKKRFAYACLDWSERKEHLSGLLGSQLLKFILDKKWCTRHPHSRELIVTPSGKKSLSRYFNITI